MKFLLDKYIAGLCFYRTAFPVQKSGLKSSAFRSKSFPQISSESYRHNAVSNRFSSHLSTSPTNAATFVSRGCGGYTLGFAQRIAHNGTHGETGGVSDGALLLPSERFCAVRKPCAAGCQNGVLCRFWVLAGRCSRRTQKAFGTAMRLCVSLSRGVAAPLGCVIFFASAEVAACTPCAQCFPNVRDEGWYHYPRRALRAAETPDGRLSKRLICRFLRSGGRSSPHDSYFLANTQNFLLAVPVANTFALWYDKFDKLELSN